MAITTLSVWLLTCGVALTTGYCRFSDGTIASTGCGGCVLEDPRLLSVCSLTGRWVRKRCNSGLRCVFRGGGCSAHCDYGSSQRSSVRIVNHVTTSNSDSRSSASGGRDCHFGNGKSATPGCSGCVATDPRQISTCESTGRWLKRTCENGGRCVFAGTSCSARCELPSEPSSPAATGQQCRFSDGKPARPGCSGCVHGNDSLLSTCQTTGRWLKTKCAVGTKCSFKQGSCAAKCDFANTTDSTLPPSFCRFANGKTANPGCSGCVRGEPQMISVCQPGGKWVKSRCNSTFNCDFSGGSCSATCQLPTAVSGTTVSSTTVPTTTVGGSSTATANVTASTTAYNTAENNYVDEESDEEVNVIDAVHT